MLIHLFFVFSVSLSVVELSSASEDDLDSEDSEQGGKGQACSHCLTTSKFFTLLQWCI